MKTSNPSNSPAGRCLSRPRRGGIFLLATALALLCHPDAVLLSHAAAVFNNNEGSFIDDYGNTAGIASASQVKVAGGTATLVSPNTTGSFRTVEIAPDSSGGWRELEVTPASLGAPGDLTVEVQSRDGLTVLIPAQPVNGPISLAALNSPLAPAIRVHVSFNKSGIVAPTVDRLKVTWRPVSRLLLDKSGPSEVSAGGSLVYGIRYSVSQVRAEGLVIYDQLPSAAAGTLVFPAEISPTPYPSQNDNPTFVAADKGGLYTASGLVTQGVTVPPNSVYWALGSVEEGVTDLLSVTLATRNGSLDMTRLTNRVHAAASNAAPAASSPAVTAIRSQPAPDMRLQEAGGIFNIGGVLQTRAGSDNRITVVARNEPGEGRETMYNSAVYVDVSGLTGMIADVGVSGVRADDFFDLSPPGGIFDPAYNPDGTGPFPAIRWNAGAFPPGGGFAAAFSIRLLAAPPRTSYAVKACLVSDQTPAVCAQLSVSLPLSERTAGPSGAGFRKSASAAIVPYGGTITFDLATRNGYAVKLNNILLLDRVPEGTVFRSAWFNDPLLVTGGAQIFYSTSTLFADWNTPPPIDPAQAVLGDLDPIGNTSWENYGSNPPANPGDVTWIAYWIRQLDSKLLPTQGMPALPGQPIIEAAGSFDVTVALPSDPCLETWLPNRGHFRAYDITDLGGVTMPNPDGPLNVTSDTRVLARGFMGTPSVSPRLSPDLIVLPGTATYSATVMNDNSPTSDALADVQAVIQLGPITVNGLTQFPSVQGISPPGAYDPVTGQVTVPLGLMAPGAGQSIAVQLGLPAGMMNDAEFTAGIVVTGQDDQCGASTATASTRGRVRSNPKLVVRKSAAADLIPSGAEYEYSLQVRNFGTGPSSGTWLVDHVPARTVLVKAPASPNITGIWFSDTPLLPPAALTPFTPITAATIARHFSPGTFHDNSTPDAGDDFWSSPFGVQTHWVAWRMDDPVLDPPQFPVSAQRTVGLRVRNDDDGGQPGTAGSPEGTLLFNAAGILSTELLQAIGNQVITRIANQPSILVGKTGPSVVEAGVGFNWEVSYHNNTLLTPDNTVEVTDTLPPGVVFLGATHAWNPVATANGAPGGSVPQPIAPVIVPHSDGSSSLTFHVAGPTGQRGPGAALGGLEGGTIVLAVRTESGMPGNSTLLNLACGTATTGADTVTSCADHQVTVVRPDLELLKFASPGRVLAGGTVTYQLVLANRGGIAARDVRLSDTLPAGVSYAGGLSVSSGYTLPAPAISGQTLTWSVAAGTALTKTGSAPGEIPAGSGNILIQFNAQISPEALPCATLNNVASVSTISLEEDHYANSAGASVTVPPPDLAAVASGTSLARPGSRVSWNLSWANQTAQSATGVYLVDTLPNNDADPDSDVKFVGVTAPAGVTAYYHPAPSASVPAFNPSAPTSGGWSATPTPPVNHVALRVGALAGNTGPFSAQLTVDLVDPNGGTPVLPPPGACFTNRVAIFQASPACENTADNVATTVTCTPALDLALTKTGSVEGARPGIAPGQTISYTLAFENSGTVGAYGVRVSDTLPGTLIPLDPADGVSVLNLMDADGRPVRAVDSLGGPIAGDVPVTRVINGNIITWYVGTATPGDPHYYQSVGLAPGVRGSFQLNAMVASPVADNTSICNTASVAADVGTETSLDNNVARTCVVARRADLAVRKSGVELPGGDPEFVESGALIRYRVEYNNQGSLDALEATVEEIVPGGTHLVSVDAPPGASVSYFPDPAAATSFSVNLGTLRAPANSVRRAVGSSPADVTPPTLNSVSADCGNNRLTLTFSERLDFSRATAVSNYRISRQVAIGGIELSPDGRTVSLVISPLAATNNYSLTLNNLSDVVGNLMPSNTVTEFRCPTPPVIVTQPANQVVEEGHTATFSVTATSDAALSYRWSRDGTNLPAATNSTLTVTGVTPVDDGAIFLVEVGNRAGVVLSSVAVLSVIPDTRPPVPVGLTTELNAGLLTIRLMWDETLEPIEAAALDNYRFGPSSETAVAPAGLGVELLDSTVVLTLPAPMPVDAIYTLIINGQADLAGNVADEVVWSFNLTHPFCCGYCTPERWVTNVVEVVAGNNLLTVPLCVGGNGRLRDLGMNVLEGSILQMWDQISRDWSVPISYIGGDWYSPDFSEANLRVSPGDGFMLYSPDATTLTFIGCLPVCARPCQPLPGGFSLVGTKGVGPFTYSNLFSCPPVCGTRVRVWDPVLQDYRDHEFLNGAWSPSEPVLANGAAAFVGVFDSTHCAPPTVVRDCLNGDTNGVYEAVAAAEPAGFRGWGTLVVEDHVPAGGFIRYSVGRLVDGIATYDLGPRFTSVSIGLDGLDLSSIHPAHTNLVLRAEYSDAAGTNAPCLKAWQMTYDSSTWPFFTFTVRVDEDPCGGESQIRNVAGIHTITPETSLINNTASYTLEVRRTDLRVQMTADKAAALPGATLTYQLDWSVAGPHGAPRSHLQVVLADGDGNGVADVALDPWTGPPDVAVYFHTASTLTPPLFDPLAPPANGWTTSRAGANHVVFVLGDRAPGSSGSLTYSAVVKSGTTGRTLVSTVTGHTARRETDCDNTDSAPTVVGNLANVHVRQNGFDCANPGGLVTFTITAGNNGSQAAANVVVSNLLPSGFALVSATPPPTGPGLAWNNLGTVPGTLGIGETVIITVVARLDNDPALVGRTLANVATIDTTTPEADLSDNRAQADLGCITIDPVSLSGHVYHDRDNDGLREPGAGETGLRDVTITLNGTDWFGVPVTLVTTTGFDGQYAFVGLNPGTYTLAETQPAEWASTADTLGLVNGNPRGTNPDRRDDVLGAITLSSGEAGVEFNFGENHLSLGNLVWRDDNDNGRREDIEPGLGGVMVQLWSPGANGAIGGGDDQLLASTVTATGGRYHFDRLQPGNYYLVIPALNFAAGASLEALPLSSLTTTPADTGAAGPDNRDVGRQAGGARSEVVSPVVNLALGQEAPADVDGDDANGMMTLDFGFRAASSNAVTHCSFTQGFYGNPKGKLNGLPSLQVVSNLLAQGPLVVGRAGFRSLSIVPGNAALLQQRLPASSTPSALPNSGAQVLATAVLPLDSKGKFKNVLLGQTITLSLNARLSPQLLAFTPVASFCTQGTLPGPDGLRGTADDVLLAGDRQNFQVPAATLAALANPALGINDPTVQGLLELANRALAGQPTGAATLADVNAAVDAINRGFDECRVLVDCSSGAVILDSVNDNLAGRVRAAIHGAETGARDALNLRNWINADGTAAPILRIKASNLTATKPDGEPDHAGNPGGKSVWWEWQAPRTGFVTVRTAGSGFDTLLAVYSGTSAANLTPLASNDDTDGLVTSEVTFHAQAGTTYLIAVDGFDGASGDIVLTLIPDRTRLRWIPGPDRTGVTLGIEGEPGLAYPVEASSELIHWKVVARPVNVEGILRFTDPEAGLAPRRFYRVNRDAESNR